ncbi:hypothetical protein LP52_06980 [Streptomonospora alba]|uniref:Uncharacterized protein n=1 Tax=Streptomonospora alba TaxID=183763 RepID=A0A0C2JKX3_9ACTN|nr:hypothetical protein LP52_06980 [Streptomonospora alba]
MTEAKLLTLTWASMASGMLSPVRLNTQVMMMLNARQKIRNAAGRVQLASGQPPHSVRNSGRCHTAHNGPRSIVPNSGPNRRCMRGRAKSRQPGSSASPVVRIRRSRAGT